MTVTIGETVDVCVCTFRRDSVVATLASIAATTVPSGVHMRVIVVDNDDTPTSEARVLAAAEDLGLDLLYLHCPARNISVARNGALAASAGDWLAFVDDDETVSQAWLCALLARARTTGADVVLGPVLPLYGAEAAEWMRRGALHATLPTITGDEICTGYTGNVLIRRGSQALRGMWFLIELGRTGGEDSDFFQRAHRAGARIEYAPDAVVWEPVTPERACIRWLMARRFRYGRTHGTLLAAQSQRLSWRLRHMCLAGAKMAYSCCLAIVSLPSRPRLAFWILRGALHMGVVWSLLGHEGPRAGGAGND